MRRQCALLNVARSGVYRPQARRLPPTIWLLMRRIDELYSGEAVLRLAQDEAFDLNEEGRGVNRKRVQRLMRLEKWGSKGWFRVLARARPHRATRSTPTCCAAMSIIEPNHVWASDITYIPMASGFLYLVAIIDWASRAVLAWRRLSNTMDSAFCVEALEEALQRYGKPRIFNNRPRRAIHQRGDTPASWRRRGSRLSQWTGRGRCFMDNIFIERLWRSIKYEEVHLKAYVDGPRGAGPASADG